MGKLQTFLFLFREQEMKHFTLNDQVLLVKVYTVLVTNFTRGRMKKKNVSRFMLFFGKAIQYPWSWAI